MRGSSAAGSAPRRGWNRSTALRKRGRGPRPLGDAVLDLLDAAWDAAGAAWKILSDQLESLRDCMKKLTDRARHILHLRYAEGIKGEALAEALQQPPNTVYVALSRIHQRLAKCIERADCRANKGRGPIRREERRRDGSSP